MLRTFYSSLLKCVWLSGRVRVELDHTKSQKRIVLVREATSFPIHKTVSTKERNLRWIVESLGTFNQKCITGRYSISVTSLSRSIVYVINLYVYVYNCFSTKNVDVFQTYTCLDTEVFTHNSRWISQPRQKQKNTIARTWRSWWWCLHTTKLKNGQRTVKRTSWPK